jgi:hypothetical protein
MLKVLQMATQPANSTTDLRHPAIGEADLTNQRPLFATEQAPQDRGTGFGIMRSGSAAAFRMTAIDPQRAFTTDRSRAAQRKPSGK